MSLLDRIGLTRRAAPIVEQRLPAVALTAAAARVDITDRSEGARRATRQPWQGDAWVYLDAIGELRYGQHWLANVMSRLRLFAAVREDPTQPPVPAEDAETPLPAGLLDSANAALSFLSGMSTGHSSILRPMTLNLEVPGDCYLVGQPLGPDTQDWSIRSCDELTRGRDSKWRLTDAPAMGSSLATLGAGGTGTELPPNAYVARLWNPHPRWSGLPDSAMRGVLDPCEQLLIKARKSRVFDRARLSRGVLLVASELDFFDANGDKTDFQAMLQDRMVSAVRDETSAASIAPLVVRAAAERIKDGTAMSHVDVISRADDEKDVEAMVKLLGRIVRGLDFPPEVVEGLGDVKYANAVAIDSTSFRYHIEPKAEARVDALTIGFLWPWIEADGFTAADAQRVVVWYDGSEVVSNPNRFPDALKAFDTGALSWDAIRDAGGFTEDDAPSIDELRLRAELFGKVRAIPAGGSPSVTPPGEDATPGSTPAPTGTPPTPINAAAALEFRHALRARLTQPLALTAAAPAAEHHPAAWSSRALALDITLRSRVEGLADAAFRRALGRAGARVVSRVRRDPQLTARVSGVPLAEVPGLLGRDVLTAAGENPDTLLDGAFDELRASFVAVTTQTWEQGLRAACELLSLTYYADDALTAAAGDAPFTDADTAGLTGLDQVAMRARFVTDLASAADGLVADLTDDARRKLFDPAFSDAPQGEYDPTLAVSPGRIRTALARAGGAASAPGFSDVDPATGQAANPSDGDPGMVATGPTIRSALTAAGVPQYAWQWVHGNAPRPFPPHLELNGQTFADQSDPQLAVARDAHTWLSSTSYRPGDHKGCTCSSLFLCDDPFYGMSAADVRTVRAAQKARNARGVFVPGTPQVGG